MRKFGFSVLCGVIFLSAVGAVFFCPDEGAGETVSAGGIEFTMPAGWVPKSAPGVKAAYDLFYQGKPYAEMYLSEETLTEPKSAAQILEDGIRKNSGNLSNYRSMGISNVRVAGTDGVLHDFSYHIPQAAVQFTGRVPVIVVNGAAYSFFFNTTSSYFPYVKGSFEEIASSVKAVEKPAPARVQAEPAAPVTTTPGVPRTVEEHCFLIDLGPGWKEAPVSGGAKYRLYNANGNYLAGFFPDGTNPLDQTIAVMCLPANEDPLQAVLNRKTADNKKEEGYKEIKTENRTVAGCPALLHDFSTMIRGDTVIQRYCLIAVKDKPDAGPVMYPPSIYNFRFLIGARKFEEAKTEIEALLGSLRLKTPLPVQEGPAAPAVSGPAAGTPENSQLPELPGQELPELPGEEDHGVFQGPGGKFTVTLPEGAVPDREPNPVFAGGPGKAATYTIPVKEGTVIVLNTSGSDAEGIVYRNTLADRLNARLNSEAAWTVEGRDVPVRIFTTADGCVLASALFPHHAFFIGVLLPRGEYNEARGWIRDMIMSVKKK